MALVGLGRLGQSVLAHFAGRRPLLRIAVGFDTNPALIGASIEDCPVCGMEELEQVVREKGIRIAILAVPPETGQAAAEALVRAGVRSIVDFTAIPLRVPDEVFVDHMDITSALESAAFFARQEHCGGAPDNGAENGHENGADAVMDPMIQTIDTLLAGAHMKLPELAQKIGARVLTPGVGDAAEVTRIYAGDRVSDLLERGLRQDAPGDQPGQPADGAGGRAHGSAGHLLRRRGRPGPGGHRACRSRTAPCSWSPPPGCSRPAA